MTCAKPSGSKTRQPIHTQGKFRLTEDCIHQFEQDGFTIVSGFASAADIEQIRQLLSSLFPRVGEPPVRVIGGCLRLERRLAQTQYFKQVREIAQQLLGPQARRRYDQAFFKLPHSNWPTQWHQDDAFAHKPGGPTLKVSFWLPLQDVTLESGCLQFIPGSHNGNLLSHYPLAEGICSPLATTEVDLAQAVPCPLKAGDITIHHGRTLHYAGPNQTDRQRLAWSIEFCVGGCSPRAQLLRLKAAISTARFPTPRKATQIEASVC